MQHFVPRIVASLVLAGLVVGWRGLTASESNEIQEMRRKAEAGDAEFQVELGQMYFSGQEVPQHFGEALKWYRRAADQGNVIAQNNLGSMYLKGQGVSVNAIEGARWIQKAANRGFPMAQVNLAMLFLNGAGVGRNPPEALRWFQRAAAWSLTDVPLLDWTSEGLRVASTLRLSRLDCLEQVRLQRRLGVLKPGDANRVRLTWADQIRLGF